MMHVFLAQTVQMMTALERTQSRASRAYMEHLARLGRLQIETYRNCVWFGLEQARSWQPTTLAAAAARGGLQARETGRLAPENVICFAEAARQLEERSG